MNRKILIFSTKYEWYWNRSLIINFIKNTSIKPYKYFIINWLNVSLQTDDEIEYVAEDEIEESDVSDIEVNMYNQTCLYSHLY